MEVIFSTRATRAADATWTAGDAVGVYVLPAGVDDLSAAKESNRKYTVNPATNAMTLAEGAAIYYPIDDTGLRFMAYYPYNTTSFDFADQSTKAKKEAVDFCFHRGTANYSRTSPATLLAFTHMVSMIRMTVKKGTSGTGSASSVGNAVVTLSGMPASATVDLAKLAAGEAGAITNSGTATITPYTVSSSESTTVVEAIIAPHSGTAGRTLTFTADGKNWTCTLPGTFAFEAGKIYAFDATLNGEKTAAANGETNCFIATTNTELTFDVSRAYESGTTLRTGGEYTGTFAAEVVWDDAGVTGTVGTTGSGNTASVTVKTKWGFPGNAVVKIFKAADAEKTAVWSYHIWVTDYDPDANTWTNTYTNDSTATASFTFMDRNLGATEASLSPAARGLYYQWGRKDPTPSTGSVPTIATSTSTGTVLYSIQHPDKFITGNSSTVYDWLYAARNHFLWGHNAGKTVYDPCPAGWRVPVNSGPSIMTSPWYGPSNPGFTEGDLGGVDWSDPPGSGNAFYPAAGFRTSAIGAFADKGRFTNYWSASPYSFVSSAHFSYASILRIQYDGWVSYHYSDPRFPSHARAAGCTVRCVRE
jgi:hypothetical protein